MGGEGEDIEERGTGEREKREDRDRVLRELVEKIERDGERWKGRRRYIRTWIDNEKWREMERDVRRN